MKKYSTIILLAIIFLASLLRLWQLGNVPFGLTNDESSYIYSAYSVFTTGRGIDGSFLPLSFNTDSSNSPVPVYLTSPFVGILGVSPFSGRLPYALLGIASVYLLFLLVKEVLGSTSLGLLSAFVLAVSPWHLQVTRAAYDSGYAIFFFLLGIYIFVKKARSGSILWSLPAFALGFYSYHATKFFFIFLIPVLLFVYRGEILKRKREALLFVSGVILILFSFLLIIYTQHVTRQDTTLLSLHDPRAAQTVDYERGTSTAPTLLKKIFTNKPLYFIKVIRGNYLGAFSMDFLFLEGDLSSSRAELGVLSRGEMYVLELPLLLLGIYFLLRQEGKGKNLFLLLLLAAPVPSTFVSGKTYVIRDFAMIPFLAILVGCGIYFAYTLIRKHYRRLFPVALVLFVLLYIFSIGSYLYQYYYRYPVYAAEAWHRSSRELSEAILKNSKESKSVLLVNGEHIFLAQYGIYSKTDPRLIQEEWPKQIVHLSYLTIIPGCTAGRIDTLEKKFPKNSVFIVPDECYLQDSPQSTIVDYGNPGHTIWKIYEK